MPLLFPVGLMIGATAGPSVTTPSLGVESSSIMTSTVNAGSTGPGFHTSATGNCLAMILGRVPNSTYTGIVVTLGGVSGTVLAYNGTSVQGDAVGYAGMFRAVAKNTPLTLSIQPNGAGSSLGKMCMCVVDVANLPASGWQGAVSTPARVNGTMANHLAATLTPQASGSLVVGVGGGCCGSLLPMSLSSGWISVDALSTGATQDTDTAAVLCQLNAATAASVAVGNTWTSGGTEDDWVAMLVELKGA